MVCLVDHHEVPAGLDDGPNPLVVVCLDALDRPTSAGADRLHRVNRADDLVERSPWVDSDVEGHTASPDEHEFLVKTVRHLGDPLELHALGRDNEDTADLSLRLQFADDQSGLN